MACFSLAQIRNKVQFKFFSLSLPHPNHRPPQRMHLRASLKIYRDLVKLRLSLLVVISSIFGYLYAFLNQTDSFDYLNFSGFVAGMFLVVTSSNIYNEILEIHSDKLMKRTAIRPLVTETISILQAKILAWASVVLSVFLLYLTTSLAMVGLALLSWLLYIWAYTPLKKRHPIAVWVGAIPGATPPLIGYITVSQSWDAPAVAIFLIQFLWQLPHFWAIAWANYKDYSKAAISLLPDRKQSRLTAIIILVSIVALAGSNLLILPFQSLWGTLLLLTINVLFLLYSVQLVFTLKEKFAQKLKFYSYAYIPLFQILVLVFG